jgi:exodeoxyribonuclease V beta subunit
LKVGWAQRAAEMQAWLDAQMASKDCAFDKRKLAPRYFTPWLQTLAAWATDPEAEALDLKTGHTRLTPTGLREAAKPGFAFDLPLPLPSLRNCSRTWPACPRWRPHCACTRR